MGEPTWAEHVAALLLAFLLVTLYVLSVLAVIRFAKKIKRRRW